MITNIYFVRHATSDLSVRQDDIRPLTKAGKSDSKRVTATLFDKNISAIYSSPYLRTVDTIKDLAECVGTEIILVDDLRERGTGGWVEDFPAFALRQWQDFDYRRTNGESLREVQARNVFALHEITKDNLGKNVAIGTHGTALSTIVNYYDPCFSYEDFLGMVDKTPYILCFTFKGFEVEHITEIELA
jgi:2,3-bisphosphoglycerate-dependent phosphoglycerate mutase